MVSTWWQATPRRAAVPEASSARNSPPTTRSRPTRSSPTSARRPTANGNSTSYPTTIIQSRTIAPSRTESRGTRDFSLLSPFSFLIFVCLSFALLELLPRRRLIRPHHADRDVRGRIVLTTNRRTREPPQHRQLPDM